MNKLGAAIFQVEKYTTPEDLCAYFNEERGIIILRKDGAKIYHAQEYKHAAKSMKNINNLKYTNKLNEQEAATLNHVIPILEEAWDLYEELRATDKLDNKKRIKLKEIQHI